jgi:hypothetical protein
MKTMKLGLWMALLVAITMGCGKVEQVLPAKDGKWLSNSVAYRSYVNSTLDSSWTVTNPTTYTFEKGGSGTTVDSSGVSQVFTWSVNPDGDNFSFCRNSTTGQDCQLMLVVVNEKNRQEYKATVVGTVNGEWTEYDLVLARAE